MSFAFGLVPAPRRPFGVGFLLLAALAVAAPVHAADPHVDDNALTTTLPPAAQVATSPWAEQLQALGHPEVLLLGEQHDAPEHQSIHQLVIEALTQRGQLAAVVLEMADAGHDTLPLPRSASATEVQLALAWREQSWPWAAYGPAVMTAVAAGVPVLGGNLPRSQHGAVMREPTWDRSVPAGAWRQLQQAVRLGHCNLLPESQVVPMTRIQVARDASMAHTAAAALTPGRTVLLLTGSQHAAPDVGIPLHWPRSVSRHSVLLAAGGVAEGEVNPFDSTWATAPVPPTDHCDGLSAETLRPAPTLPTGAN